MGFTAAQKEAIEHEGHLLIVAGPGSGKTTTFIQKALRILQDPRNTLLMTTFTKDGAEEMRRRLQTAYAKKGESLPRDDRLNISTFHSVALRHLRKSYPKLDLINPANQNGMLADAIKAYARSSEDMQLVRQEFETYMYAIDRTDLNISENAHKAIALYTQRLQSLGKTDLYTVMRDCAIKVHAGDIPPLKISHMLVDEGQDTDALQKLWIFAHARAGSTVTIVGDDDQSIYEWRNALGYTGMKDFLDTFGARRIELGDNFRCRAEILTPAVRLVEHNKARLDKDLVARRGKGGVAAVINTQAGLATQSQHLAKLIALAPELHTNTAILARQNHSLDKLEIALKAADIKYKRLGKSIWDNEYISSYMNFLEGLLTGDPAGAFSLVRFMNFEQNLVSEFLATVGKDATAFLDGKLPELAKADGPAKKRLQSLASQCAYWRKQLRGDGTMPGSVTEIVYGVAEAFKEVTRGSQASFLLDLCAGYLDEADGTLSARLRSRGTNSNKLDGINVVLMTMHGSKGMEFDTVHIIDASKPDDFNATIDVEPERRLMYVALTRAKDRCFAWYSAVPHPTIIEANLPILHGVNELCRVLELPPVIVEDKKKAAATA